MFNVLIADDEELIRRGMSTIIDWNDIGFQIAGTAKNGKQALDIIESTHVDVVLLDIKMPKYNGLELSEYLSRHHPTIKIVILSGYADFEYAQATINYQVFAYLLKPSRKSTITETFLRLREALQRELEEAALKSKGEYSETRELLLTLIKDRLAAAVTETPEKQKSSQTLSHPELATLLGVNLDSTAQFRLLVFERVQHLRSDDSLTSDLSAYAPDYSNLNDELISRFGYREGVFPFVTGENLLCILIAVPSGMMDGRVEQCFTVARSILRKETGTTLFAGLGTAVDNLDDLRESYTSALECLRHTFGHSAEEVIRGSELQAPTAGRPGIDLNKLAADLLASTAKRDLDEIRSHVRRFVSTAGKSGVVARETIQNAITEILVLVYENALLRDWTIRYPQTLQTLFRIVETLRTYADVETFLTILFRSVQVTHGSLENDATNGLIRIAINHIQADLGRPHSLDSIADVLDISPSYFSRLFKRETGMNFKDYLMSRRIAKAQALLQTSEYKVYEVAYSVGFTDPHYFSKVFRTKTGYYPTEYRNRVAVL
jgi:two-component system response regulator YesN